MNIHHIGVIVKNLNKSIDIFSSLGYDRHDEIIADQYQKNKEGPSQSLCKPPD